MKQPFISVIIPVLSINNNILLENLPTFKIIKDKNFEVIILPNTVSKKENTLQNKYPWLRLVPTNKITRPAQKRDIGARKARGDILAFIDDDAYPTPKWLESARTVFKKSNAAAVCGPGILPRNANFWERVFDEILKTWIGSGGLAYRFIPQKKRFVDDYPSMNFLIKKDIFIKLGGFNSDFWPGEDSKLCEDLVYKNGGKIAYSPHVVIYHHRRNNLGGYLHQHGQYGYHRGAFFAHGDRNSRHLFYLVPSLFVLYLLSLLTLYGSVIMIIPLFLYTLLLSTVFSSALKNTSNLKIAVVSTIVLFLMHIVYGVQFMKGLFIGTFKKEKIY